MSRSALEDEFQCAYERYRALPEGTKAELVAGQIRVRPRPRPKHVRAASALGVRLGSSFGWDSDEGPGGWVVLDGPELRLGDEIRAPATHGEDDLVQAEPFAAKELDLGALWRLPGRPA